MHKHLRRWVVAVVEADCIHHGVDRSFRAGEEVPASRRGGSRIALHSEIELVQSIRGRLAGIETDAHDFEVAPWDERERAHPGENSTECLIAEIRARVVHG